MSRPTINPSGRERFFDKDEIIVSKTDLKGKITYANRVFMRVAGYTEAELLGKPHNLIRHPAMPRCVFKLLWDTLEAGQEIFAYVINLAKDGSHYWVFAHVTPSLDHNGEVVGYHSNRRVPPRSAVEAIEPIYATLLAEENKHSSVKEGMAAAGALLGQILADAGTTYPELAFSLSGETLDSSCN